MTTESATTPDANAASGQAADAGAAAGADAAGAGAEAAVEGQGAPAKGFGDRAAADAGEAAAADGDAGELDLGAGYLGEDGKPDLAKMAARLKAADEAEAARQEKAGEVPADAAGYELPDMKELGIDGAFDPENAELKAYLAEAHASGKGKAQVKAELAAHAKAVKSAHDSFTAALDAQIDAEFQKIGKVRFNAAKAAVTGALGEDDAKALDSVSNAGAFTVIEKLIAKLNGGDAAKPGRTTPGASGDRDFAAAWDNAGRKTA